MKLKYLIVDDEPFARKLLASHSAKVEGLELGGECANALEAINALRTKTIDLIFLDIQMPEISGLDFIKTLKDPPAIILTTAYRDFALEAFDLDVVDYLLKPISFERFLKAVNKVFDRAIGSGDKTNIHADLQGTFMYVKFDRKMHKVILNDILYIESLDDYVKVFLKNKVLITRENISSLETKLPANQFVRIHRSFIVAINEVSSLSAEGVQISGKDLPFGRVYRKSALL